jgi:hypothetical protein
MLGDSSVADWSEAVAAAVSRPAAIEAAPISRPIRDVASGNLDAAHNGYRLKSLESIIANFVAVRMPDANEGRSSAIKREKPALAEDEAIRSLVAASDRRQTRLAVLQSVIGDLRGENAAEIPDCENINRHHSHRLAAPFEAAVDAILASEDILAKE